jgi:hypothetical protein
MENETIQLYQFSWIYSVWNLYRLQIHNWIDVLQFWPQNKLFWRICLFNFLNTGECCEQDALMFYLAIALSHGITVFKALWGLLVSRSPHKSIWGFNKQLLCAHLNSTSRETGWESNPRPRSWCRHSTTAPLRPIRERNGSETHKSISFVLGNTFPIYRTNDLKVWFTPTMLHRTPTS